MATFNIIKVDNSIIEENISQEAAEQLFVNQENTPEFAYFWYPAEEEVRTDLTNQHGDAIRFVKRNNED